MRERNTPAIRTGNGGELDLIDLVQKHGISDRVTVRFVKDLLYSKTKRELASIFGVREGAIDDYRKKDYLPFSRYILLRDDDRRRRSLRFRKSPHNIPATIPLDLNFARLVGFYLAEGHADDHRIDFSFNKKEVKFISELRGGSRPRLRAQDREGRERRRRGAE